MTEPSVRKVQGAPALAVRFESAPDEMERRVPQAIRSIRDLMTSIGLDPAGPAYTRYLEHSPERGVFRLEAGVPVSHAVAGQGEVVASDLPEATVLSIVHEGPYRTLGESFGRLAKLVAERGLKAAGAPWEAYVVTASTHPDPAAWRTELCQPVE